VTKGDYYHDDVWTLKYLKGFKYCTIQRLYDSKLMSICRWDYLTEKLAYERRMRENKLKMAMLQVLQLLLRPDFRDLISLRLKSPTQSSATW
jgi:hypothetical protein